MEHQTRVTVRYTEITYFNETTGEVKTDKVAGRLAVPQCRDYVSYQGDSYIFVKKSNLNESFNVDTIALTQLRITE